MKRTQLQLDEATYQLLRRRAFERGVSMAALIRQAIRDHLKAGARHSTRLEDFEFIGVGCSGKAGMEPISERHDEALAEDFSR